MATVETEPKDTSLDPGPEARATLVEGGAWIDLGNGNGVTLLGLDAPGLTVLIDTQLAFI